MVHNAREVRAAMLRVRCYAKVNLGLCVLGRRADGYHELRTVFQTISLHDTLEAWRERGRAAQGIVLQRQSQRFQPLRNHDQVNVIRHQAIVEQQELVQACIATQQIQVNAPVAIRRQDELTSIPALGNVVWDANGNHPGKAS